MILRAIFLRDVLEWNEVSILLYLKKLIETKYINLIANISK